MIVVNFNDVLLSKITINGIVKLAEELRTNKYQPNFVQKIRIPKINGSFRSLGIIRSKDKIVQQAIYLLLEPLYERLFSNDSHGFRKSKTTHTCLSQIKSS